MVNKPYVFSMFTGLLQEIRVTDVINSDRGIDVLEPSHRSWLARSDENNKRDRNDVETVIVRKSEH